MFDPLLILLGLVVGLLVGFTGMGGGALMPPALSFCSISPLYRCGDRSSLFPEVTPFAVRRLENQTLIIKIKILEHWLQEDMNTAFTLKHQ